MSGFLDFSLGDFVTHPQKPEWGLGQVQSITGMRVVVNFEEAGKLLINCDTVDLQIASPDDKPHLT